MINPSLTLQEYWDLLSVHDWFYDFSDDPSVVRRGGIEQARVDSIARQSNQHYTLLIQFKNHHNTGPRMGTPKFPKPKRPE
jgi:hypothetical protein